MKKIYLGLILCLLSAEATVYEDAEDSSIERWTITDNSPKKAKIKNVYDKDLNSKVIQLKGSGYKNEYTIGGSSFESANAWHQKDKHHLSFLLKNKNGFIIDVVLKTNKGLRYIRYMDDDTDRGIDGEYTIIGLGYDAANNKWNEHKRDLLADLKKFDLTIEIIEVQGLSIRGNCKIDNIELVKSSDKEFVIYEDAEDEKTDGWKIIENKASGTVTNVLDKETNSRVIKLNGTDSYENKYGLTIGNNGKNFNLKWDMKTKEGFIVDVLVMTTLGERLLRYRDEPEADKGIDGDTIFYGLGYFSTNGKWHTHNRNLQKDLSTFEPNNKILSVKAFLVSANCSLDNIELFSTPSKIYENAEDGKNSRWRVYSGPASAKIINKYDKELKSRVISLKGEGYRNLYIIGGDLYDENGWNDTRHTHVKWSMKNSDGYVFTVLVKTKKGNRYIQYKDDAFAQSSRDGEDISYGLGYDSSDGKWHTHIRDIASDIKKSEADNELLSIEGISINSSVEIDNLELFKIHHPVDHSAGFVLTFDDNDVDGWFSMRDTYLEYGIKPTFFLSHFHNLKQSHIAKLKILELEGAEIGGHTYSHGGVGTDFDYNVDLIDQYLNEQIKPMVDNMKAAGFNPESFAYPYGEHQEDYDIAVRAYFPYLRTTVSSREQKLYKLNEIFHKKGKYYNILAGEGIDNSYGNEIDEIRRAFIKASKNGEIITLYAHLVLDDPDNPYAISPKKLKKVIQLSKELGLKSYTFKEAYLISK